MKNFIKKKKGEMKKMRNGEIQIENKENPDLF